MEIKTVSRQRTWQLRKVAAGCCSICGKKPLVTANHCLKHATRANQCASALRQAKRAKGICPIGLAVCTKRPRKGFIICTPCLAKLRAYRKKRRESLSIPLGNHEVLLGRGEKLDRKMSKVFR